MPLPPERQMYDALLDALVEQIVQQLHDEEAAKVRSEEQVPNGPPPLAPN